MALGTFKNIVFLHLCLYALTSTQISCPRGTRISNDGKTCIKCGPGTYASAVNSRKCTKCPSGTYTPFFGVQVRRMCLPCPLDSTSSQGSSKCRKCRKGHLRLCKNKCIRCRPGTYVNAYSCKCEKCDEETYSSTFNAPRCEMCPQRFQYPRQPQRDRCVNFKCPDGFEHEDYGECIPCDYNEYRNGSMRQCEECPYGTSTNNFNGPNKKCEVCPPGNYLTDNTRQTFTYEQVTYCAKCPNGWSTNGFGKALCHKAGSNINERCPANSFLDKDGDCHVCGVNQRLDVVNKKCLDCPKDWISKGGLVTKCTKCPGGQKRFRHFAFCTCEFGKEAVRLPNGSFECKKCQKGTHPTSGTSNCQVCPSGYTTKKVHGVIECVRCPIGTTTGEDPTRKSCKKPRNCPTGLISAPPGKPQYFKEDTCVSVVSGCPKGTKLTKRLDKLLCADTKSEQIKCPDPATSLFDLRNTCVSCPTDQYLKKNVNGVYKCRGCEKDELSNGGKTKECNKCPSGFQVVESYPRTCSCPEGKFIDENGDCRVCPKGTLTDTQNSAKCFKCPKGFVLTAYSNGSQDCVCPPGSVINVKGECVKDIFKGPEYTNG